jgi:glutaredoxin-like YruB-family protein
MGKVIVYSTQTCPYCVLLKNWLDEKKVSYEYNDVGVDQAKAKEMIDKTGQMGVPVIDIDGDVVIGFNQAKIESSLKEKGFIK